MMFFPPLLYSVSLHVACERGGKSIFMNLSHVKDKMDRATNIDWYSLRVKI